MTNEPDLVKAFERARRELRYDYVPNEEQIRAWHALGILPGPTFEIRYPPGTSVNLEPWGDAPVRVYRTVTQ